MIKSKPKPALIERPDGRIELRGRLYARMRCELCALAEGRCELCGVRVILVNGHAHHAHGRGGGKRDDRIFVNGERNLLWACPRCHDGKHRPAKVVPAKMSDAELKKLLGVGK